MPKNHASRPLPPLLAAACVCAALPGQDPSKPPQPWRLDDLVADVPWLHLSGIQRSRIESLNGQFRADPAAPAAPRRDTEDQLFFRTSLRADIDLQPLGGTLEILDGRAYFGDDANSLTGTGFVNTTDVLQAYATYSLGQLGDGGHRLLAGRYTMSLGSRRFVIRNGYRNTINNFTGVDWLWQNGAGENLRAFWTMPVRRRPFDAPSLRDNDFEWDDQNEDLQFFGVFGTRRLDPRTTIEGYVFGLEEDATGSLMRSIYTPGVRLFRPAKRGDWFAECEASFQFGRSRLSATGPSLDHSAYFAHASIGYQADRECVPTVRLAYDYASGDEDPNDGDNNRFDSLFGAPRFEYGPTGMWGTFQRSNSSSPELRVSCKPCATTWIMLAYRDFRLAESRDQWVGSGVVDASGAAGNHIGQQLELRARWDVIARNMYVECGGAYLFGGSYLARAPNSQGPGDSRYGYVEMIWTF